jgi:transcription initiation factor TFIIIB Brf1 subunit/transcription initiation factor TFIIB
MAHNTDVKTVANQPIKRLTKSKLVNRSIMHDMLEMKFPDDIKQRANLIYQKMSPRILRRDRKMLGIFYCIYSAHKEIKNCANPQDIADLVGIDHRDITRAISVFSEVQTGYKPPQLFQTARNFIPDICEQLNLSNDSIDEIIELYNHIEHNDKTLCDEKPNKVAIAVVSYWLKTAGVTITEEHAKILGVIGITDPLIKRVQTADNAKISTANTEGKSKNKIIVVLKSNKNVDPGKSSK